MRFTAASYQHHPSEAPFGGCRASWWRPVRASIRRGRPHRRLSNAATGRGGRGLPIDPACTRPDPSLPSSHFEPAVRAPRSRAPWRRSRSSVTTRSAAVSSASPAFRTPSTVERISASAVRGPLYRTVMPDAIRSPRSPGSAGPSKTSSMAMGAGITARSRPISAAGGAAPAVFVIVWRRFVPSIEHPDGGGERVAVGGGHRAHRTRDWTPGYDRPRESAAPRRPRRRRLSRGRSRARRGGSPGRPGRPRRRRRVRHQQLDALPGRLPDAAGGDGRAGHARHGRVVGPRDGALPPRPRSRDPPRARPRRRAASSASCATSATTS